MDDESTAPWAMQLALRDDRGPERPSHLAVCESAAVAVVLLLTDPRSIEPDGEWHQAVTRWRSGAIRKVVRRGRGIRFTSVQRLPGVEVERRSARVRAFVPGPTDQVPAELAKLQVGGTDQPDRGEPSAVVPGGLSIALTPRSAMTTGKSAAQCGHAAQLALEAMDQRTLLAWRDTDWAVRVLLPDAANWARLERSVPVTVHDGGFTEVEPGTRTALAWWSESVAGGGAAQALGQAAG